MKKHFKFLIAIVFAILLIFLIFHKTNKVEAPNPQYINIGGQKLQVDIADTPVKREQGLSGRTGLKVNEGMLFDFPNSGIYSFWMKDMKFPIDIIWINEEGKIVYIKKNALPDSYPALFTPENNSKYVLEVVSGFCDKYNIKIGDRVELH
ncbi:MAG: DUF192 domain-containing protein [Candidatus Paceibacterota bacterium]